MSKDIEVNITVTINKELYDEYRSDSLFLKCLMAAGVDNWSGYEHVQESYDEESGGC